MIVADTTINEPLSDTQNQESQLDTSLNQQGLNYERRSSKCPRKDIVLKTAEKRQRPPSTHDILESNQDIKLLMSKLKAAKTQQGKISDSEDEMCTVHDDTEEFT